MTSALQHFSSNYHANSVLRGLHSLQQTATFCDITLRIGTVEFAAHRNVLGASSQYFSAMLTGGLLEGYKQEVDIHGVQPAIFQMLLDFIYTGEVELGEGNCQDLLVAADMFQMTELVGFCADFLQSQLHPSNCLGIYQFAETHACVDLKTASEAFVHNHFLKVIEEEEYLALPKEILNDLLQSENLRVDSEYQVFTAAMKWILYNVFERRRYVFEIMENIRFPIIPQNQIEKYSKECSDLSLKVALLKLLQDMRDNSKLPYVVKLSKFKPVLLYPRKCARKSLYVIGGFCRQEGGRWSDSQTLSTVEKFDTFGQYWRNLPPLDHPRSGHGVCTLNGLIYAVGGESDSLIFDSAECFDPSSNQWTSLACMTVPRCGLGLVTVENTIYAIGGWVGSEIGDSIEKYDPELDQWLQVDKLATLRFAMGAVEYQGIIYIIGGMSDVGMEMRSVESYNPVTRDWQQLASMHTHRAYTGVAVMDDCIFAVGGWNERQGSLKSVEKYSITQDTWTELPYMSVARAGASVATVNGLLYVIGGRTAYDVFVAPSTLNSVECYDPQTDSWIDIGNMPTSRCEAGIAVL